MQEEIPICLNVCSPPESTSRTQQSGTLGQCTEVLLTPRSEERCTELDNGQVIVLQFYSFTENTVQNKLLTMVNHNIAKLQN